ncbi:4-hydroxy-3-methylbut-2-enyl diphosphate reductase [Alkalidesulfovibrio alkalitolerans DSM 16529]|jgi:4-hydroxy-3-methylbut-2-enyl diphosphate reductase|uniref:4-hydroxy-3-methylbut-2-enyl diphosphate reductase n=1 Tax=Alkalidesulfovibrio alkalitolerans DSM 16529 TaxID=1121439 RepID=S7UL96_9BACT|nr:4-hydroxy-3-methylbut-2-enyl diphosphate reductase [Alkalidesulfovibrio alkalitolerans]EPR34634.1 4-hydroxy-3-methylbut-2-enyl diphosphate reductase [Alkalidesulfovibrio alkalitolerans DSM 16529]
MNVLRAETAGFCMGVDLALRKLDTLIEENTGAPVLTFGPIIHNPQVLAEYDLLGVRVADLPRDIPQGSRVVIRAHGIPRDLEMELDARQAEIHDATCPRVKKAQILIKRMASEDRIVLLYGEAEHPEVKGLVSYASAGAFVFDSPEELAEFPFKPGEKYCLAAQTTQDKVMFQDMAQKLLSKTDIDAVILETICDATRDRQKEALAMAREVEFMIVVGGRDSGNTRRLAKVVADEGVPCVHVETASELPLERLRGLSSVGLTAGASTPKKLIDEVQKVLENL